MLKKVCCNPPYTNGGIAETIYTQPETVVYGGDTANISVFREKTVDYISAFRDIISL